MLMAAVISPDVVADGITKANKHALFKACGIFPHMPRTLSNSTCCPDTKTGKANSGLNSVTPKLPAVPVVAVTVTLSTERTPRSKGSNDIGIKIAASRNPVPPKAVSGDGNGTPK